MAFQLCLASGGELGITNCLQGWEGGKQTLHGGREGSTRSARAPQLRTHKGLDAFMASMPYAFMASMEENALGKEKVKSQAGNGKSWEAALLRSHRAPTCHSPHTCSCSLPMGEQWWGALDRAMQGLAQDHWEASLPSPGQAWEERENCGWMQQGLQLLHLHPSAYAHLCSYLTLQPYPTPPCQPCSKSGWQPHSPCAQGRRRSELGHI